MESSRKKWRINEWTKECAQINYAIKLLLSLYLYSLLKKIEEKRNLETLKILNWMESLESANHCVSVSCHVCYQYHKNVSYHV